jgi:hypothetical protein
MPTSKATMEKSDTIMIYSKLVDSTIALGITARRKTIHIIRAPLILKTALAYSIGIRNKKLITKAYTPLALTISLNTWNQLVICK